MPHIDQFKLRDALEVGDTHANILFSIMVAIFEDTVTEMGDERFIRRFGTLGRDAIQAFQED